MHKKEQKLFINGRFFAQKRDGISRFSLEICKELQRNGIEFTILIPKKLNSVDLSFFKVLEIGNSRSHLWEQVDLYLFMKERKNSVLLNFSGIGSIFLKNQIITIHDVSYFVNPNWFSKFFSRFYQFLVPIAAKKSLVVLTVSEFSKSEIVKYIQIPKEKIYVIYNATNLESQEKLQHVIDVKNKFNIDKKIILAVSTLDPRKNLNLLIDAFCELNLDDYQLVLVGGSAKHFNYKSSIENSNTIFTGFVSDEELITLYKSCEIFVYPSLYEGFGIPPLEAMEFEAPVLLSDIPCLKEIYANSAHFFKSNSKDDLKRAIINCTQDDDFRTKFVSDAKSCTDKYTWENSAKRLIEILKANNISINAKS